MDHERIKTERAGPKNGGGAWITRTQAKQSAGRKRRQADEGGRLVDAWGDLDQFGVQASRGVLRHMTEDEERADLSWEEFRLA